MKSARILNAVFFMGWIFTEAHPGAWSEALLAALGQKDFRAARTLILAHEPGCGFVADYSELESGLKRNPGAAEQAAKFRREFRLGMDRAFSEACLASFERKAGDTTASPEGRTEWLHAMLSGRNKLHAANRAALSTFLLDLLRRGSTPGPMQVLVLANLDKQPSADAPAVYFEFLNAGDSTVRNAAYKGLMGKVRANRRAGNKTANRALFNALIASDSASRSLNQVRVLATLGENYARDYLLAHCSGDRTRMAALFYRDDSLTHSGILQEAVTLLAAAPADAALRKAIRYGTKNPGHVIDTFLAGQNAETLAGMRMLDLFPEYAPAHESTIRTAAQSGNEAIRSAARALLPYLPPGIHSTRNAGGLD